MTEPLEMGEHVQPNLTGDETYTRPQMENRTLGREVQSDSPQRANESSSHAAEEVRVLVQSLMIGADSSEDEVVARLSMAILEAQEQERSRLAEELHDGPAQALANAIFQTEILERAVRDGDSAIANEELVSLREILERELDTLRAYINQLRPSLGEAAGLDDALRDSAAGISQRSGIPVEVTIGAPSSLLPEAARTVVLRVAQESLRNIAKHSGASRAWLVTRTKEEPDGSSKWLLEVGDDGRGFDIDAVSANPNRRHFGLRFMRERAELLGSELSITTIPAGGTVVRLSTEIGG